MNAKLAEDVAPSGSCEFVGKLLYPGASGRKCGVNGCSCFLFAKSVVYVSCPSRAEKLREQT